MNATQLYALWDGGKKLSAIKALREAVPCCDLKDAKDAFEMHRVAAVLRNKSYAAKQTRLEAAAPDLLAALKLAKSRLFGAGPATDPLYAVIRDAIAKAES